MNPIRLSQTWYRRMYVTFFVAGLFYASLYILPLFEIITVPSALQVNLLVAIGGAVTALGSLVLVFIGKKNRSFVPSLIIFLLFAITTFYLMLLTGQLNSPYLVLWSLVIFMAPIFGMYGWVPGLITVGYFFANSYLSGGITPEAIITITLSNVLPLLVGIIIWRDPPENERGSNHDVMSLANQLSEVATKSEVVINAIGDGVIAIDGKGIIQLINPAGQEMLGWGKQDALMLHYKSILKLKDEKDDDIGDDVDPIQQVLNNNQQARANKLISVTKSGRKISVSIVASPIGDPGAGAIAVFRDVTKERAEEREQAEFISTASHEMRTPVASIEGYLGLALNPNTATVDIRARDFINKAHEAAGHLGRLFQDLLDVTKSEDGRMTNIPKVIDLVPFTQTIVQGLSQKAADKNLRLTFVPEDLGGAQKKIMPVYFVNVDNDHIREVLDNLIENAIKYTPSGEIKVNVTGDETKVVVSIKDTGLGIPAEDIPHLFQKFYRINNVDRQDIGGTGLGLYLSRRLVEAMQGRIWVESSFGKGSTFYIELPRTTTQDAEQLRLQQVAQAATQPSIQPGAAPVMQTEVASTAQSANPTTAQANPVSGGYYQTPPANPAAQRYAVTPANNPVLQTAAMPATSPAVASQTPIHPINSLAGARSLDGIKPATTVPRGQSLSKEEIAERARQLEAMAQAQNTNP